MNASAPSPPSLAAEVWDAVVVGAGPAGCMTARELARRGARVLLVERRPFPRWKVCGACLSPGTLSVLQSVGLGHLAEQAGAIELRSLRVSGWSSRADVPLEGSVAWSRASFDKALVEAAVASGVTFAAPARARLDGIDAGGRTVVVEFRGTTASVRTGVVIAADGLGSALLSAARGERGPEAGPRSITTIAPHARIGFGAVFHTVGGAFEPGTVFMAVGRAGYVGLVRLESGALNVAAALDPGMLGRGERPETLVHRLMEDADFPPLEGDLVSGWGGTPALTRTLRTRGAERLFAVGDAAGYVEPFTGEGITWALSGALTLAPIVGEAIAGWRPDLVQRWDGAYRDSVGRAAALCRGVAWGLRRPAVSRTALNLIRLAPGLAAPFVRRATRAPVCPSQVAG